MANPNGLADTNVAFAGTAFRDASGRGRDVEQRDSVIVTPAARRARSPATLAVDTLNRLASVEWWPSTACRSTCGPARSSA